MACNPATITVGGTVISASTFANAQPLLKELGHADMGDPTFDEYTNNIAGGNNSAGIKGYKQVIQLYQLKQVYHLQYLQHQ